MKRNWTSRMQTKGQVLVAFVILLPFLCAFLFALIGYGMVFYEREKLENVASLLCPSVLEGKDTKRLEELAYQNDASISSIKMKKENEKGTVVLEKEVVTVFFGKKRKLSVMVHCVSEG